jgi:hypothetical protein
MDDDDVLARINELAEDERRIHASAHPDEGLSPEEHGRLDAIEVTLDQLWDYLRRRRARRRVGGNPDEEPLRDAATVESYLQ